MSIVSMNAHTIQHADRCIVTPKPIRLAVANISSISRVACEASVGSWFVKLCSRVRVNTTIFRGRQCTTVWKIIVQNYD